MRRNRLVTTLLLVLFVVVTARVFVQFGRPLFSKAQEAPLPESSSPGATGPSNLGPHAAFFDYGGNEKIATMVKGKTTMNLPITVMFNLNAPASEMATILRATQGLSPIIRIVGVTPTTDEGQIAGLVANLNSAEVADLLADNTLVVFGNELNNLDREYIFCGGEVCPDQLAAAGQKYGQQFTWFRDKAGGGFIPVPAPPDMYNGNYPWMPFVSGAGVYNGPLVANVYTAAVPERPENLGPDGLFRQPLELYQNLANVSGGNVVAFTEYGLDPTNPSLQAHVDFLIQSQPPVPATTLIPDKCKSLDHTTDQWLFYIQGKIYNEAGFEIDPASCSSTGRGGPPPGDYYKKFVFPFYPANRTPEEKVQTMVTKLQKDYTLSCVRPADYESFITEGIDRIFTPPYLGFCKGQGAGFESCLFEPTLSFSMASDSIGQLFGTLRDETSAKWRAYDYSQDNDATKRTFTSRYESVEQWFGANNPDVAVYRNTTPDEIKSTHQGPFYKLATPKMQCFAAAEIMNATQKLCEEWMLFKSPDDPRTECPLLTQPVSGTGVNMGQLIGETTTFMDRFADLRQEGMTDAQSICTGYYGAGVANNPISAIGAVGKDMVDKILSVDLYMETAYRPAFLVMTTELDPTDPPIAPNSTQRLSNADVTKPYSKHIVDYLIYHVPSTVTDMDSSGIIETNNSSTDHQDIITRTIRTFTSLEKTAAALNTYKQDRDSLAAQIEALSTRDSGTLEVNCTTPECQEPVRKALIQFINAYLATADGNTLDGCKDLDDFINRREGERGTQIGSEIAPTEDGTGLNEDKAEGEATLAETGDLTLQSYYDRNGVLVNDPPRPRAQTRIYNISPFGFRSEFNSENLVGLFANKQQFNQNHGYYQAFEVEFTPNFQTSEDTQNYYNQLAGPESERAGEVVQTFVNGGAKIREESLGFNARFRDLARVFSLSTRAMVQNISEAGTAMINCAQQMTDPTRNTEEYLINCGRGGRSGSGGTTPTIPGGSLICSMEPSRSELSNPLSINSPSLQALLVQAANKYNVPVKALITTLYIESCRQTTVNEITKLPVSICSLSEEQIQPYLAEGVEYIANCPGGGSDANVDTRSKGVFQMYHTLTDGSGNAVHWGRFRENPGDNICNIPDSIYAAANYLSYIFDFANLTPRDTDDNIKSALTKWAYGPSGTCDLNAITDLYCDAYDSLSCR